jgi:cytochrome c oxidase subunit 1
MITITFFFFVGGAAATLMRLELMTPQGDVVQAETYNKLFTLHGIMMVWFFLVPSIPNVLGNFLVPIMIGARDLAFPRLNLLSWYIFALGGVFTVWAMINGGVDTGWTFYTPYSTMFANTHVLTTAIGVFISGFSSILTGLNFIVTIHKMRAPGLTWFRLPLFIWSQYATSLILVLATPVLAITLLLVALERWGGVGIFDPSRGGDPILFQHLFWFYSHPVVYVMILPGMGVVSEIISCFARKKIFGYHFMAFALLAIAVIGFLVWGHHMFVSGMSMYAGLVFSILSFLVAVPSAIKVFNWTATLHKGSISFETPMLYALGFIGLFTIGGLTGLILASLVVDIHVHDTYFVVAHFHYIMVGSAVMAYLGGIHFWWPKMTGVLYPELAGKLSALTVFVGFNLTFFPQFLLGYLGMTRRYYEYHPDFQVLNVMSTAGASILAVGYLLPLIYLSLSLHLGPKAGPNPWNATGLEWLTASPPPTDNFEDTPTVTEEPYNYGNGDGEHA